MSESFDYARDIGSLPPEQRLLFYESLPHSITIFIRVVLGDPNTTDAEKVEQMKWINELMHRVVVITSQLRCHREGWTEASMWSTIEGVIRECPKIKVPIYEAIRLSYHVVAGKPA